jgi:ribosomal protein L15
VAKLLDEEQRVRMLERVTRSDQSFEISSKRFQSFRVKHAVVNLVAINAVVKAGDTVSPAFLVEKNLINKVNGKNPSVKILGTGEIAVAITVSGCAVSASAKAAIEKAGGKVA